MTRLRGALPCGSRPRRYLPDFIVLVDDGHGEDDLLRLILRSRAIAGRTPRTRRSRWTPTGCQASTTFGSYGRWAFAEFTDVYAMQDDLDDKLKENLDKMIDEIIANQPEPLR